jgi:hypothetical protein
VDTTRTTGGQGTAISSRMPNLSIVPIADARSTYGAAIAVVSERVLTESMQPVSLAGSGYAGNK